MRITAGTVSLTATHESVQTHTLEERLRSWVGAEPQPNQNVPVDRVSLPEVASAALPASSKPPPIWNPRVEDEAKTLGARSEVNRLILEKVFGFKMTDGAPLDGEQPQSVVDAAPRAPPPARAPAGFGMQYDRVEVKAESEKLTVQAQAKLTTSDGRVIDVDYALVQSRQTEQRDEIHLRVGDAPRKVDPLALDLDGGGVQLQAEKMAFDLDADGNEEQISRISAGDAWLAVDRNQNGHIDDGHELFGPKSGDGFGELRALDGDGNGFIDEADAAYTSLRLWRPSSGTLSTLAEAGAGAIGLAAVDSPFQLQGGVTRETGIYLRESGTAGAVQHVDLEV